MDNSIDEVNLGDFYYSGLEEKLDNIKQIITDLNYEGNKESSIKILLQNSIQMLNIGVDALEYMKKMNCTTSCIVTYLISYEKGVILSFKHCSESNLIYGELIINVKELLTELFKKTSEMQILFFNIIENINFDFTLNGELDLLLNVLEHIWYGAEAVYKSSNKIMTTNWKIYITLSQKYSTELKENIINDEPINFLCAELKKNILSFHYNDEVSLKLSTYLMSVLVKLCSYGRVLKSHKVLIDFILFLNSYWLSDTQDVLAIKDRLLSFSDQIVLVSDEMFMKIFQSSCQDIINKSSSSQKMSALYIAMLLLKRLIITPNEQQAYEIICVVFQLIKFTDSIMCYYNIDIYESLLINTASLILVSDFFNDIEKILIQNIINTKYWPAMFSSDLWIIIMRYLSPELCNLQFTKLARLLEVLNVFPCYTQCPQHIYLEILLRRHFALITDKKQLMKTCVQLKNQSLKSAIGILEVPTLSKYNCLSKLVKIITILPEQKSYEHLNKDIIHLWHVNKDEYPASYLCALVEVSIGSEILLKNIFPKIIKILGTRTYDDTTHMKHCRLRLIRSTLHMLTFHEKLVMEILIEYLFDSHPLIQQWTVETIVYISSIIGNQNNLIHMLFQRPEVTSVIKDYLEMKINHIYNFNDFVHYYKQLSLCGQFKHKCSINQLDKILDKLEIDLDCLNKIVSKTQISVGELERLKKYSSMLNNICNAIQLHNDNV